MWKHLLQGKLHPLSAVAILMTLLVLAGCGVQPAPDAIEDAPTSAVTTTPAAEAEATASADEEESEIAGIEAQVAPPVSLRIDEIDMNVAVTPMTWRVAEADGVRTTAWVLPQSGAGWHPNSAGVGAEGNVVISGHQLLGDAPFAPIALGDIVLGQEIVLADAEGNSFTYVVTEVTEPLPIPNTLSEEQDLAEQYAAPTSTPTLTLISGWPDFSTTHRVIVRAELVSDAQ